MLRFQKKHLVLVLLLCLTIAIFNLLSCSSGEKKKEQALRMPTPEEQREMIAEAYIYGYPLVLSGLERDISTAEKKISDKKVDKTLPNVNEITSSSWIDVSEEPVVLRLPAANGRYYALELMSAWTDVFASLGPRTSGSGAHNFVITGPQWSGNLPFTTREIKSPTNSVWIIGHIQVYGAGLNHSEVNHARAFQNRLEFIPLSQFSKDFKAPMMTAAAPEEVDVKTPAWMQVRDMDAKLFYSSLAEEMKKNPPMSSDQKIIEKLRMIGMSPGEKFVYENLPFEKKQLFDSGYQSGRQRLADFVRAPHGQVVNGWTSLLSTGTYGNDYAERAFIARSSLGASLVEDIYYQWADYDENGQRLSGKNHYILHFAANQAPPTYGFWSLTMYDAKKRLVTNSLHRYSLTDHHSLNYQRDGSFDVYIQPTSPGRAMEANWLPSPQGNFQLMARLYWPKKEAISGAWKMPGIQKVFAKGPSIKRLYGQKLFSPSKDGFLFQ